MEKVRLLRITTVPISLKYLLEGQLSFMTKQGFEVLAVSAGGSEIDALTKEGISHRTIEFTRAITPFHDLACLRQLISLIKSWRPTIVHTHTPKAGLLGMLAAWICRVPIRLHTVAGLPLMETVGLKRWLLLQTERITYSCATRIYPNSPAMLQYINGLFSVEATKLKVIGKGSTNGIDISYFQKSAQLEAQAEEIRKKNKIALEDCVYCFVGRVVKDKGIAELLASFLEIEKLKESAWLILVGHFEDELDPLPDELKALIAGHSSIIHCGFQEDVRPWILASDVFVLPSYREGFPNVVLQAGALEKPCIVSDINGCNEIVEHGKTGLLIQSKNVDALKAAMVNLLRHRDEGRKMGVEARKLVSTRFERSNLWNELLSEYHDQIERCTKG